MAVPAWACGANGAAAGADGRPAGMGARDTTLGLGKEGPAGRIGSLAPAGMGWRGPESTWPGRRGGTGLTAGIAGRPGAITAAGGVTATGARCTSGGAAGAGAGELPASGGRTGCD